MKYQLNVTLSQAKVISIALDLYSRISGGQFVEILNQFDWVNLKEKDLHHATEMLTDLKCMLTGLARNQPNMGLGNICESGKIAYDLHQVVRHRLANDDPRTNKYSVSLDQPMKYSNEVLAKIEQLKEDR